jgi:putative glutathione S-transferase
MGRLIQGEWSTEWYEPDASGAFQRPETQFRSGVVSPEAGRYHLYVSTACPWAHRTLITRALRGLEHAIGVTVVSPKMTDDGWSFSASDPDPLFGSRFLRDLYVRAAADYTGRVTVPVLWDKKTQSIVNNESRELMRMLDLELDALATDPVFPSLAPPELRPRIDEVLDAIYAPINPAVYRAGFATQQGAYESACRELFDALDEWDRVLGTQRFTCGDRLTEADVALFTTLFRFDLVYHGHFKCNVRRIQDYENLWGFVRDVYQTPGVRETCDVKAIKTHYYWSHETLNPHRIVPLGPAIDFDAPHTRARVRDVQEKGASRSTSPNGNR